MELLVGIAFIMLCFWVTWKLMEFALRQMSFKRFFGASHNGIYVIDFIICLLNHHYRYKNPKIPLGF